MGAANLEKLLSSKTQGWAGNEHLGRDQSSTGCQEPNRTQRNSQLARGAQDLNSPLCSLHQANPLSCLFSAASFITHPLKPKENTR